MTDNPLGSPAEASSTATPGPRVRIDGPAGAEPTTEPPTALVLGHSRFPASDTALDVAAELAARLHAHLHVVHGISLDDYPIDPDAADWEQQAHRVLDARRARVQTVLADSSPGWSYHAGRGDPVGLISAVADEHDALMIIVGSRGEAASRSAETPVRRAMSRSNEPHRRRRDQHRRHPPVAPLLARFLRDHPGLEHGLRVGNAEQVQRWLLDGEVGLAVLAGRPDAPQLLVQPMFNDCLALIGHPTIPWPGAPPHRRTWRASAS